MAASLVYRAPWIYELVMIALYGRHYGARYRAIAGLIPEGSSVLDVCCGPGVLYERYLRGKGVQYTGLDLNPQFVERLKRMGAQAQVWDLHEDQPLPPADIVLMQASLYHFLPNAGPVVERMIQAAKMQVILAEPIRNLSTSGLPLLSKLAARNTDAGQGEQPRRFTERSLDELLGSLAVPPSRSFLIPGGREKVYVLATSPVAHQPAAV